jgi:hypothetical protein
LSARLLEPYALKKDVHAVEDRLSIGNRSGATIHAIFELVVDLIVEICKFAIGFLKCAKTYEE